MGEDIDAIRARKTSVLRVTLQLVAIAIFVLLIVYFMRKYAADISNLKNLSILDIFLIGAWSFVSYTAYAAAVYAVLVAVGLQGLGSFAWLRVYFVSRLANLFVTQGGNLFRLVILKKKYGFSYTNSIGITVFLIWINVLIALLASVLVLAGSPQISDVPGINLLHWSVIVLLLLLIGPTVAASVIVSFRESSIFENRLLGPIANIASFFSATLRDLPLFSRITILSIVHFVFFVGVNYFTFRAIGQPVGFTVVCLFTTAFVFTRYINVVPGNVGLSELVGGLVSEQLGVGFGNGLLVSGIVRIVEVLMILLVGLMYGKFLAFSHLSK